MCTCSRSYEETGSKLDHLIVKEKRLTIKKQSSAMTFSIMDLNATLSINDVHHNDTRIRLECHAE
jgi:hypothetical protein